MPVDLKDRVEFVSEEWLQLAAAFFSTRPAPPPSMSFSLCEIFRDPPRHLATGEDVLAWTLRIDGGNVDVRPGTSTDVDLLVEGVYNEILCLATGVYAEPGDQDLSFAQHAHLFGVDAAKLTGPTPTDEETALLNALHNHMARHTIDNPDVNHRITSYGLAVPRAELADRGYTILEGAISEQFADELRDAIVGQMDETPSYGAAMLLERGRIFERAALHPWVVTLAESLVGRGCLLAQTTGLRHPAGRAGIGPHSDYNMIREPFPPYAMNTTTIWALEDFTLSCGPTMVQPYSHTLGRHPTEQEKAEFTGTPILMPKGSIAMWDGALWHDQSMRDDPGDRYTLHNTYSRMVLRPYDDYLGIDHHILDRNPPALTTLCGHDDLFSKNTHRGPDLRKLAHAAQTYDS